MLFVRDVPNPRPTWGAFTCSECWSDRAPGFPHAHPHVCMHMYAHTHSLCMHTYAHPPVRAHICVHTPPCMHTYTHTPPCMHTYAHSPPPHACTGTCTHTPPRACTHVHTQTPPPRAHAALGGCPTRCPADKAWLVCSAASLFLPVSRSTPHQVFNCLFTRSSLERCNISLIREQKVGGSSFGGAGSGKGLTLGLFPVLPPELSAREMLGTGIPGCESGHPGAWLRFTFQLGESRFLSPWQQLEPFPFFQRGVDSEA